VVDSMDYYYLVEVLHDVMMVEIHMVLEQVNHAFDVEHYVKVVVLVMVHD